MKKYIVSFLLLVNLLMSAQVFAGVIEDKFSTCSRYVSDNGKEITMVLGWINRKCYYMYATSKYKIDCGFTKTEHTAMVKAMNQAKRTNDGRYYFADFLTKYAKNLEEAGKQNLNEEGNESYESPCSIVIYDASQN